MWLAMCIWIYVVYMCAWCVCVYAENTSAASLQLRLEDMKQEQPHLSQAVEYI